MTKEEMIGTMEACAGSMDCPDACPYMGEEEQGATCMMMLLRDAAAMMRGELPHVLKLPEIVDAWKGKRAVWLEDRSSGRLALTTVCGVETEHQNLADIVLLAGGGSTKHVRALNECGETWRLWNDRPPDGMRWKEGLEE